MGLYVQRVARACLTTVHVAVRFPPIVQQNQRYVFPVLHQDKRTHHNIEIYELFCESRHIVNETERVFSDMVGSEDIVALSLACSIQYYDISRVLYFEVYVKRAPGLHL